MRYRLSIIAICLIVFCPVISGKTVESAALNFNYIDIDKISKVKLELLKKANEPESDSTLFEEEPLPVIFFAVNDSDNAFKEVRKWGGTHVHRYGMGKSIENDQAFFDRAEKYGLKVMSDLRARYWLKEDKDIESFHSYINHFKEHPALGFWYLVDEPDNKGFTPDELKPYYKSIDESTSVPIAISHAWTKNWYKFGNVQDVFMYNFYPILGGAFPETRLEEWTRFTEGVVREAGKDNNLVMSVLQIFNWKFFADSEQKEYRSYKLEELRYPNLQEFRYMVFTSLAAGARGLSLFSYATSKRINPQWGDQVLEPVIKEAKKFAREVGNINSRIKYSTDMENLFLASWSNNGDEFMVLVNATSTSRPIQLAIDREIDTIEEYKPWGQTREVANLSLTGSQLSIDKMEPWEVIILKK